MRKGLWNSVSVSAVLFIVILFHSFSGCEAASVDTADVELYILDSEYKNVTSIPENYRQNYQISVVGAASKPKYTILSGDSVTVDENGLVTPTTKLWYWVGNVGFDFSTGDPNEEVDISYNTGTSVVQVSVDGETYTINITVKDYAEKYAYDVVDAYLASHINSSMTNMEKVNAFCSFVAGYDYSTKRSSMAGMVCDGGGDCWASSSTLLYMCEKSGIPAHLRYGANDAGAGSGHRNVAVLIDGKVYQLEAGFTGNAPRSYHITEIPKGFSYRITSWIEKTAEVYQYDGFDTNIVVPDTINDYTVTSIGKNIFYYGAQHSKVHPVSITLPKTLKEIGEYPFADVDSLTQLLVVEGNETYSSVNGVLMDKAQTTVLAYPGGRTGEYQVPDTVHTIGDYAFYYSKGITIVTLPVGIKTIGIGAFGECSNLMEINIPVGLETIAHHAFYNTKLENVVIPSGVKSIEQNAFPTDTVIYGVSGSAAERYAKENGNPFCPLQSMGTVDISGADIQIIGDTSYKGQPVTPKVGVSLNGIPLVENTDYMTIYSHNDKPGIGSIKIIGIGNYTGIVTSFFNSTIRIEQCRVILDKTNYMYQAKPCEPAVTVMCGEYKLVKDKDYTIIYENNVNPGTATVTINGIGDAVGSKIKKFSIKSDVGKTLRNITITGDGTTFVELAVVTTKSDNTTVTISEIIFDAGKSKAKRTTIADKNGKVTSQTAVITLADSNMNVKGKTAIVNMELPTTFLDVVAEENTTKVQLTISSEALKKVVQKKSINTIALNLIMPFHSYAYANNIQLDDSTVDLLAKYGKNVKITVKRAWDAEYTINILGKNIKKLSGKCDITLDRDVATNSKGTLKKDIKKRLSKKGLTLKKAEVIIFAENKKLSVPQELTFSVSDINGLKAGSKVYVYKYNANKRKFTLLSKKAYKVSDESTITVKLTYGGTYLITEEKL